MADLGRWPYWGGIALVVFGIGLLVALLGVALLSRIKLDVEADKTFHFASVEKVFAVLMIFTACSMAFAHGANDVANAVGPLAAIVGVIESVVLPTSPPSPQCRAGCCCWARSVSSSVWPPTATR